MRQSLFAPALIWGCSIFLLLGCSLLSFAGANPAASPQPPIQLIRCSAEPSALCLQSFGLGQDQLLISFYFPAAGSSSFLLKVWEEETPTTYPCTLEQISSTILYCTGPLIPLGTPLKIDLFTKTGTVPLAQGDFTLTDLALPTLSVAGPLTPISPLTLPTTPLAPTAYPNPRAP